jgi:hypothetical protein
MFVSITKECTIVFLGILIIIFKEDKDDFEASEGPKVVKGISSRCVFDPVVFLEKQRTAFGEILDLEVSKGSKSSQKTIEKSKESSVLRMDA